MCYLAEKLSTDSDLHSWCSFGDASLLFVGFQTCKFQCRYLSIHSFIMYILPLCLFRFWARPYKNTRNFPFCTSVRVSQVELWIRQMMEYLLHQPLLRRVEVNDRFGECNICPEVIQSSNYVALSPCSKDYQEHGNSEYLALWLEMTSQHMEYPIQ